MADENAPRTTISHGQFELTPHPPLHILASVMGRSIVIELVCTLYSCGLGCEYVYRAGSTATLIPTLLCRFLLVVLRPNLVYPHLHISQFLSQRDSWMTYHTRLSTALSLHLSRLLTSSSHFYLF